MSRLSLNRQKWTDEEVTPEFVVAKMLLWRKSFWSWFVDCVYTIDEGDSLDPVKPAPAFRYLKHLSDQIQGNKTTIIVKTRQMYITHFMSALFLWYFLFKPFSRCILMSQKEAQVKDVIATRIVPIYKFLDGRFPWPLLEDRKNIKSLQIEHPDPEFGSLIMGLPSGSDQTRGKTATLLWLDEFGFQDCQEDTMRAAKPAVNGPDAKLVLTSTPALNTLFHELVRNVDVDKPTVDLMEGLRQTFNRSGDNILALRFDADPYKRSREWQEKTRKENSEYTWRVEYNLEWTLPMGKPVFPEFDKTQHCKNYEDVLNDAKYGVLSVGIDFGGHFPAVVFYFKDSLNRCILDHGILAEDMELTSFMELIKEVINERYPDVSDYNLFCDPAGKTKNNQGTAPPAVDFIQDFFKKRVRYLFSKPRDRVQAIRAKMSRKHAGTMGVMVNPNGGRYISKDGEIRDGIFVEALEYGYVYEKSVSATHYTNLSPKKDGFFEHLMDAWGYAFIFDFSLLLEAAIERRKNRGPVVKRKYLRR